MGALTPPTGPGTAHGAPGTPGSSGRRRLHGIGVLFIALLGVVPDLDAQILSPGKLSRPHAEIEGVRNCTRCHVLRTPGVSRDLCLDCHATLARRIEAGSGFHAILAEPDCAACHKDHLGPDYAMVRFDPDAFDHDRVTFVLDGAHDSLACRTCHDPSRITDPDILQARGGKPSLRRTWMGLPTDCSGCHSADDPHGEQFEGRLCTDCHDTGEWQATPGFDHARTSYPLTGLHVGVACGECHREEPTPPPRRLVRYTPISHTSCSSCHTDPHEGRMRASCDRCHSTRGWARVRPEDVEGRFDHAGAGFPLVGRHVELPCASCHDPKASSRRSGVAMEYARGSLDRAFPRPLTTGECASCHVDAHAGAFESTPTGGACDGCHGQESWQPARYGIDRHNRESGFPLEGGHLAVPCASCHRDDAEALVLRPVADACVACHGTSDPHGSQFEGRDCDACHSSQSFRIERFDHESTRFRLEGAHAGVACAACHPNTRNGTGEGNVRYRPLGTECRDCHGEVL